MASPFIATQALPLYLYYRVRQSVIPSVLSGVLVAGALWWVYWTHPLAMFHAGDMLALWYPYGAFELTIVQIPGMIWVVVARFTWAQKRRSLDP